MIAAVIADDLTGAAELASAAAELGFSAEVHTTFDPTSGAEIVCLDTNSRLLSPEQAADIVGRATQFVLQHKPAWLYKKTDSVLRGNVRTEIGSILRASHLTSALLVPANPTKSRVIRGGTYFVNGIPLSQTSFANDPHYPRNTADVRALLGVPNASIEIPDVTDSFDLHRLATALTPQTLPAGGVEFFEAVLQHRTTSRPFPTTRMDFTPPILFCSGSLQGWSTTTAEEFRSHKIPVIPMPEDLRAATPTSGAVPNRWVSDVCKTIESQESAAICIGEACDTRPDLLTTRLAETVSHILRRASLNTLVIEGGSTASAILHRLSLTRLHSLPTPTLPGISALSPVSSLPRTILMKPGSYPWPPTLWPLIPPGTVH